MCEAIALVIGGPTVELRAAGGGGGGADAGTDAGGGTLLAAGTPLGVGAMAEARLSVTACSTCVNAATGRVHVVSLVVDLM
jgi:hypothetical protein